MAHTAFQGDDVFRKNKGLVIESGIIGAAAPGRLVGVESFNSLKANQFPTPWNPGRALTKINGLVIESSVIGNAAVLTKTRRTQRSHKDKILRNFFLCLVSL